MRPGVAGRGAGMVTAGALPAAHDPKASPASFTALSMVMSPTNVSERIGRLKTRVQARKESVEELERRIDGAVG